jgi:hypothetical protein
MLTRSRTHGLLACCVIAFAASCATANPPELQFELTGADVSARFFHRAGMLQSGEVIVSGGMRLIFPPSLVTNDDLAFYDVDLGAFSNQFQPTNGGPAVSPVLATPRSSHTQTTLIDGRVLFTGGNTGANGTNVGSPVDTTELFDPVTGVVTAGPIMSRTRYGHRAIPLPDGRVVIAGGGSTWQIFDPDDDSLSDAINMQRFRRDLAAVLLPDHGGPGAHRVLLIAGSDEPTLEMLDPDAGTSTLMSSTLTVGGDDLAAALLPTGNVLIVGGQQFGGGDTIDDSYLYDPVGDVLTPIDPPPGRDEGIADHQLVVLGRYALVMGGEQQVDNVDMTLDYVAVFDSDTSQWVTTGTMLQAHDDAAAVALGDASILVIDGGIDFLGEEAPTTTAEIITLIAPEPCPEDLNGDGLRNISDLGVLLASFEVDDGGDIDGDGDTDIADLGALLAVFDIPCL